VKDQAEDQVDDLAAEAWGGPVGTDQQVFSPGCFRIERKSCSSAWLGERILRRFVPENVDVVPHR
jgi:hypothetical protein